MHKSIMGRVACLGKDVLKLKYAGTESPIVVYNQQKCRLDLFLQWLKGEKRPNAEEINKFLFRKDIFPFIKEQEILPWSRITNDFEYLVMDSFSELTDQKFKNKNLGWSFCCHYSDIDHSAEFEEAYECDGLLPMEQVYDVYMEFFSWFETKFPNKKIVYFHFPTALDERGLYKERGKHLLDVMSEISKQKDYIYNFYLENDEVCASGEDSFCYHYHESTYKKLLSKWEGYSYADYKS